MSNFSWSRTGSGRKSTPWISANITVVAVIPRANVRTAAAVKNFARRNPRPAMERSLLPLVEKNGPLIQRTGSNDVRKAVRGKDLFLPKQPCRVQKARIE
jgi:hypothetical protein